MLLDSTFSFSPGMIGDIAVLAIIIIFAIVQSSKGFFRCLVGFVGTVLSLVLAFVFCKAMAASLQNWFGLLDKCTDWLTGLLSKIPAFTVPIDENVEGSLAAANVPSFVIALIVQAIAGEKLAAGTTSAQLLSPILANMFLLVISFLIIYVIIKIICFILNKTLGAAISSIPGIRSLNALLGFVLGAAEGIFLVCCLLFLIALFPIPSVTDFVYSTTIMKFFYNNNFLGYLIQWIISTDWLRDILLQFKVIS